MSASAVPSPEDAIERVRQALRSTSQTHEVWDGGRRTRLRVSRVGLGALRTKYGRFYQMELEISDRWRQYSVLFPGPLDDDLLPNFATDHAVPLRVDSGCDTGQITGDLTCDCRAQLDLALRRLARRQRGLVVRVPEQEGKGWGMRHKLAAHWLQEQIPISNVEAVMRLFPEEAVDCRTYGGVAAALLFLGVPRGARLQMMTNNPDKVQALEANGFHVAREPLVIPPTPLTRINLLAKQRLLSHIGLVPGAEGRSGTGATEASVTPVQESATADPS